MLNNISLVAQREFLVNVRKRSFLFAVFGMPILMGVLIAIVIIAQIAADDTGVDATDVTIGYVDLAEIVTDEVDSYENFIAYTDDEAARAALDADEVDVYFVLPQLYMATGTVRLVANEGTSSSLQREIRSFIVDNLATQVDSDIAIERIQYPVDQRIILESTGRELTGGGLLGLIIVPVIFIIVMVIGIQLSSTFLMSGVVEEKTNHIMEILITSVRPVELLAGKVIGLSLLGLVQIGVWLVIGVVLYLIGGDTEIFSAINIPLDTVIISLLYFLLTYFMFAAILAGVGSIVGGEQESRQYASIVSILLFIPMFLFSLFLTNPTSPILTTLTFIPFTAAMTYMLKSPFAPVPYWQVAISLSILAITTVFMIWASAKVFRWGILLEGKKVGIGMIIRVIAGGRTEAGTLPAGSQEASA